MSRFKRSMGGTLYLEHYDSAHLVAVSNGQKFTASGTGVMLNEPPKVRSRYLSQRDQTLA